MKVICKKCSKIFTPLDGTIEKYGLFCTKCRHRHQYKKTLVLCKMCKRTATKNELCWFCRRNKTNVHSAREDYMRSIKTRNPQLYHKLRLIQEQKIKFSTDLDNWALLDLLVEKE